MKKNSSINSCKGGACIRSKRTAIEVAGTALLVGALLLTACSALAFDLPRVIGEFKPEQDGVQYAEDFCCIGDQNGDGKDELFLSTLGMRRYEIFLGADHMGDRYDFAFNLIRGEQEVVRQVFWIGRLMPELANCYATHNFERANALAFIDFYNGLGNQQEQHWGSWQTILSRDGFRRIPEGVSTRPSDFNGDGFDDVFCFRVTSDTIGAFQVHFGGADYDSTPDWSKSYPIPNRSSLGWFKYVSGYDLNNDGYHDILFRDHRLNFYIYRW